MPDGYHSPTNAIRKRVITRAELARHTSKHDAWISVHGVVLDVSKFKEEHPGGESILMLHVGTTGGVFYMEIIFATATVAAVAVGVFNLMKKASK
ncbi:flavohemoprotein b5/b5r, putative [Perkinsus marinus ATCC 50983]|uniref:Flavohemoprotein b5/b5r, putative n=1 Tax=Perkinsus marinus (strain ATCC 50983 / TXsc) TaxID=423536 RepID=C5KRR4_PERM5|nr:flavohemoprotein b5/b5r, putative [Perkinsus marinus ATCC 50983]EER12755.1 flavohemoprotein b5/b5r, putative [Perkinsus marinus ATCC 50983]|eukprot:XP_002780960.1 flavohemoprotein b5/b5r, putative [Perkinsus marinus ATCC 50983]